MPAEPAAPLDRFTAERVLDGAAGASDQWASLAAVVAAAGGPALDGETAGAGEVAAHLAGLVREQSVAAEPAAVAGASGAASASPRRLLKLAARVPSRAAVVAALAVCTIGGGTVAAATVSGHAHHEPTVPVQSVSAGPSASAPSPSKTGPDQSLGVLLRPLDGEPAGPEAPAVAPKPGPPAVTPPPVAAPPSVPPASQARPAGPQVHPSAANRPVTPPRPAAPSSGHPLHPAQPVHPTHPVHPTQPVHPTHPATPASPQSSQSSNGNAYGHVKNATPPGPATGHATGANPSGQAKGHK